MSKSLVIKDVSHAYEDVQALDHVSITIDRGSFFCVLGPNGSGKSTLFRCLSTLMRPSSGDIILDEEIDLIADPSSARKRVGTVFQHHSLDRLMTVNENLLIAAALYGMNRSDGRKRVDELATIFDLSDRLDTRVDRLSGGLARRVDLVRGLLHAPAVLLLDEPTTGLDPAARLLFWNTLEYFRAERNTTIVFTTHLMEEAEVADRLVILDRGSTVVAGTPHEIKASSRLEKVLIRSVAEDEICSWLAKRDNTSFKRSRHGIYVSVPDPLSLIEAIRIEWENQIDEVTIRRPSLEDIFFEKTGYRFDDELSLQDQPEGLTPYTTAGGSR